MAANIEQVISSEAFVSTMAGAFVGAFAAFCLNAFYEFKKGRDAKHAAIVKAQYILCTLRNDLENITVQSMEKHRTLPPPERAAKLARIIYPFSELRVDAAELIFLVVGEHPNELNDILLAQRTFINVVDCVEFVNELKNEIESSGTFMGLMPGGGMANIQLSQGGVLKVLQLTNAVDNLYVELDIAGRRLEAAIKLLATVGKAVLMERAFLRFETNGDRPKQTPTVSRAI